jgi:starch synthase
MKAKKVLFINQEITPYVPDSELSLLGRNLPQAIQEKGYEIRTFMPKWGNINERRGQLHEVIRLSRMMLIIDETDHPLIIKVASIPQTRIQVYFIDNEDYFRRKQTFCSEDGKFFEDNDERAIFFARGVLETVKKLRWAPDVIHCQGWISHLVPAYLKKAYKDDPIFSSSKIVLSLYDDLPEVQFRPGFAAKAAFGGLGAEDLKFLDKPDGINLAKTAIQYADGVIISSADIPAVLQKYCKTLNLPVLPYDAAMMENGTYIDAYNAFYDKI